MTLMQPLETIEVEDKKVACDGGGGALGHPRVFLNMGEKSAIDCPYCGRRYRLRDGVRPKAHGH